MEASKIWELVKVQLTPNPWYIPPGGQSAPVAYAMVPCLGDGIVNSAETARI